MRSLTALFAVALVCATVEAAQAYPAAARASVNMRTGPATTYRVAMVVPRGAQVDVRSCTTAWCRIAYRNRLGYVSRAYLAVRPAPPPPPVAQRRPLPPPPAPGYDDPRYDDPRYTDPRYDDPRYADPRYGYDDRYGDPYDRGPDNVAFCVAEDANWAVGRRATNGVVNRARDESGADLVRVVGPDDIVTQEFRRDRLTLEVDYRNVIMDVRCG
jgi:uncharacterized protein YraI